jgi:hypothetical protein
MAVVVTKMQQDLKLLIKLIHSIEINIIKFNYENNNN